MTKAIDKEVGIRRSRRSGPALIPSFTIAAMLSMLPVAPAQAQSDPPQDAQPATSVGVNLNITPKRLTFDRTKRTASVYIINQGTVPATFDISVTDRVMLPNGEIREAAEVAATLDGSAIAPRLQSARQLILTSPRRVNLAPGKGQTIRVRVTPPSVETASGEYRSHLTVTTIPPRDSGVTAEQISSQRPDTLNFRVQTVFGLSIPIIIRHGAVDARAAIDNVRLETTPSAPEAIASGAPPAILAFDLLRSGAHSLFGNIEVRSRGDTIGVARGVGVYPEIGRRAVRIPLRRALKPGEHLEITFTDDDLNPGEVTARASFSAL